MQLRSEVGDKFREFGWRRRWWIYRLGFFCVLTLHVQWCAGITKCIEVSTRRVATSTATSQQGGPARLIIQQVLTWLSATKATSIQRSLRCHPRAALQVGHSGTKLARRDHRRHHPDGRPGLPQLHPELRRYPRRSPPWPWQVHKIHGRNHGNQVGWLLVYRQWLASFTFFFCTIFFEPWFLVEVDLYAHFLAPPQGFVYHAEDVLLFDDFQLLWLRFICILSCHLLGMGAFRTILMSWSELDAVVCIVCWISSVDVLEYWLCNMQGVAMLNWNCSCNILFSVN